MNEEDIQFYFSNFGMFPIIGLGFSFLCCCFGCYRLWFLKKSRRRIRPHIQRGNPLSLSEIISYNEFLKNEFNSLKDSNMGANCSTFSHLEVAEPGECFICYQSILSEEQIKLKCHHWIHTPCLLQWWNRDRSNVGMCPLCRQSETICLLELTRDEKDTFVGFYRNDDRYQLSFRIPVNNPTRIIVIQKDAIDMTQHTSEMLYSMYLIRNAQTTNASITVEEV